MPETPRMTQTELSRKIALRTFINEHGMREDATYDDLLRRDKTHVDEAAALIASELAEREQKVEELVSAAQAIATYNWYEPESGDCIFCGREYGFHKPDCENERLRAALSGLGVK